MATQALSAHGKHVAALYKDMFGLSFKNTLCLKRISHGFPIPAFQGYEYYSNAQLGATLSYEEMLKVKELYDKEMSQQSMQYRQMEAFRACVMERMWIDVYYKRKKADQKRMEEEKQRVEEWEEKQRAKREKQEAEERAKRKAFAKERAAAEAEAKQARAEDSDEEDSMPIRKRFNRLKKTSQVKRVTFDLPHKQRRVPERAQSPASPASPATPPVMERQIAFSEPAPTPAVSEPSVPTVPAVGGPGLGQSRVASSASWRRPKSAM